VSSYLHDLKNRIESTRIRIWKYQFMYVHYRLLSGAVKVVRVLELKDI